MRRIGPQKPAFVQPKGLPTTNKDAMNKVVTEVVTEKAVELVEQKTEEIEKKVEETTDKVLDTVQENTQAVADKVEDAVEKVLEPMTDVVKKLEENPEVKKVIDTLTESVAEQVDGREFSCSLFGWLFALRITRKSRQTSPSTPSVTESKLPELPLPREEAKESPPPKAQTETETSSVPPIETSVSV